MGQRNSKVIRLSIAVLAFLLSGCAYMLNPQPFEHIVVVIDPRAPAVVARNVQDVAPYKPVVGSVVRTVIGAIEGANEYANEYGSTGCDINSAACLAGSLSVPIGAVAGAVRAPSQPLLSESVTLTGAGPEIQDAVSGIDFSELFKQTWRSAEPIANGFTMIIAKGDFGEDNSGYRNRVLVKISEIQLSTRNGSDPYLSFVVSATMTWQPLKYRHDYTSESHTMAEWTADESALLRQELTAATKRIAALIVGDINRYTPVPLLVGIRPKTGDYFVNCVAGGERVWTYVSNCDP